MPVVGNEFVEAVGGPVSLVTDPALKFIHILPTGVVRVVFPFTTVLDSDGLILNKVQHFDLAGNPLSKVRHELKGPFIRLINGEYVSLAFKKDTTILAIEFYDASASPYGERLFVELDLPYWGSLAPSAILPLSNGGFVALWTYQMTLQQGNELNRYAGISGVWFDRQGNITSQKIDFYTEKLNISTYIEFFSPIQVGLDKWAMYIRHVDINNQHQEEIHYIQLLNENGMTLGNSIFLHLIRTYPNSNLHTLIICKMEIWYFLLEIL